jgi:hypothetical protein
LKNLIHLLPGDFFADAFTLIEMGFGLCCLFVATGAWSAQSARTVRWLFKVAFFEVFWFSFAAVDTLCVRIIGQSFVVRPGEPSSPRDAIVRAGLQMLPLVAAMLLYQVALRWALAGLKLTDERSPIQRLWSVKVLLVIIGLVIVNIGADFSDHVWTRPGYQNHGPVLRDVLTTFGPLLLAVIIYKMGTSIAARRMGVSARGQTTEPRNC